MATPKQFKKLMEESSDLPIGAKVHNGATATSTRRLFMCPA
jgi:hypothetical protein